MKIAHVITRMIVGGAQENTLATVIGLKNLGHEVILISGPSKGPEGTLEQNVKKAGIKFIVIPELIRNISPWHDTIAFFKLGLIFRQNRFDVIHTHSAKAGFLGRIAAKVFSRKSKVVHTLHGPSFYPYQPTITKFIYVLVEKIAGFFTDYFISVSEIILERYLKHGIGKKEKSCIIRSGFNVEQYQKAIETRKITRKGLGVSEKEILIGMIGRLFPLKGQEYLLRVFAKIAKDYPNAHLLLVGDGILRENFEMFVKNNNLEKRVHFTGLVDPEKIPFFASAVDIGVHTSLREGLPRAVVQILAAGKPVIAFDVDGAREVVRDGINGFLIPAKDEKLLEERLRYLIENPKTSENMGRIGQKMVFEEYSVEKMIEKTEKVYLNIV
ncbi:MAG: glycosyltransferase family 4 protein [Candidatus Omnitrophica bacterium]|nr:glycosyltransferase family 4 protein [Candidatus Omnitrophota bacterium]MCM8817416.1 glycosyltransferase family 4 protein [Candidatus Omnitrophota bacterium]